MRHEITSNRRIYSILSQDNNMNPEKILPILKSEIKRIIEDYLVLSGEIKIKVRRTDEGCIFTFDIPSSSIKNLFVL